MNHIQNIITSWCAGGKKESRWFFQNTLCNYFCQFLTLLGKIGSIGTFFVVLKPFLFIRPKRLCQVLLKGTAIPAHSCSDFTILNLYTPLTLEISVMFKTFFNMLCFLSEIMWLLASGCTYQSLTLNSLVKNIVNESILRWSQILWFLTFEQCPLIALRMLSLSCSFRDE